MTKKKLEKIFEDLDINTRLLMIENKIKEIKKITEVKEFKNNVHEFIPFLKQTIELSKITPYKFKVLYFVSRLKMEYDDFMIEHLRKFHMLILSGFKNFMLEQIDILHSYTKIDFDIDSESNMEDVKTNEKS